MGDVLTLDQMTDFMTTHLDSAPVRAGSTWGSTRAGVWDQGDIDLTPSPKLGFHLFEMCVSGHCTGTTAFDANLGSPQGTYRPNALFYMPQGQSAVVRQRGRMDVFQVWIDDRVFSDVRQHMFKGDPNRVDIFGFNERYDAALLNCAKTILRETRNSCGRADAVTTDAAIQQLAIHLLRFSTGANRRTPLMAHLSKRAAQTTQDYIEDMLDQNIGLGDMAAVTGQTTLEFTESFTETFGQPPQDYLRDRRIERAITLLTSTDAPLDEIAKRCGFGLLSNMVYHFVTTQGVAPLHFRTTGPQKGNIQ